MKHTLYFMLGFLILTGCSIKYSGDNDNIEKKIEHFAVDCKCTNYTIDITKLTNFKWDTVYVFNYSVPKDLVEQIIGTSYPDYQEGTRPMVFVHQGKITHSENNPDGMLKNSPGQVIYNYSLGLRYGVYTPRTAVFTVKVEGTKGKTFYQLNSR